MTVTLAWLLTQSDLGLRLVTDVATTTEFTWAHAIEVSDPAPWLSGGELVLTTGLRLGRSAGAQRGYAERLADAGISGIGFGVACPSSASRPRPRPCFLPLMIAIPYPLLVECTTRGRSPFPKVGTEATFESGLRPYFPPF